MNSIRWKLKVIFQPQLLVLNLQEIFFFVVSTQNSKNKVSAAISNLIGNLIFQILFETDDALVNVCMSLKIFLIFSDCSHKFCIDLLFLK